MWCEWWWGGSGIGARISRIERDGDVGVVVGCAWVGTSNTNEATQRIVSNERVGDVIRGAAIGAADAWWVRACRRVMQFGGWIEIGGVGIGASDGEYVATCAIVGDIGKRIVELRTGVGAPDADEDTAFEDIGKRVKVERDASVDHAPGPTRDAGPVVDIRQRVEVERVRLGAPSDGIITELAAVAIGL